jgi:signal transduction histidine kinase
MTKLLSRFDHAIAGVVFLGLLVAANPGLAAGDTGTAEEAKAMLERAVAAIETDEAAALAAFTAGDEGFKDRDLYVFCGDAVDGTTTAHGANSALVGQSMRDIKDKAGKAIGEEFYAVATEGEFNGVEYVWPRPGETAPSPKTSYITKAGNQVCGVGYYK